jgi:glycerate-2-kinase
VKLPAALIAGGETVVTLPEKHGKGGRNQEIGLVAALRLQSLKLRDIVLASVGTDGTDGPTDAAGAIVDGGTISRIEEENNKTFTGDDALRNHDAYTFFNSATESKNALVKTGATGTNVADVCVVLVQ